MKTKFSKKKIIQIIVLVVIILGISLLQKNYDENVDRRKMVDTETPAEVSKKSANIDQTDVLEIDKLTAEKRVVDYVKKNGKLPDYYLTKNEARKQGWSPQKGDLCEILPGKAIGGDRFGNREGLLPKQKGRAYFEADLNYSCGHRNADRLVYSNDGLVYITKDHYKTFQKQ